jgi:hypothetical protein
MAASSTTVSVPATHVQPLTSNAQYLCRLGSRIDCGLFTLDGETRKNSTRITLCYAFSLGIAIRRTPVHVPAEFAGRPDKHHSILLPQVDLGICFHLLMRCMPQKSEGESTKLHTSHKKGLPRALSVLEQAKRSTTTGSRTPSSTLEGLNVTATPSQFI